MHWRLQRLGSRVNNWFERVHVDLAPNHYKRSHELKYWRARVAEESVLGHDHYEDFYTTFFALQREFYRGKSILDVGCGPRGSLEWASMAADRIGIDPLANDYLLMGASNHAMKYVCAPSEEMPFDDDRFDVVCSFNSLDHVQNEQKTATEMVRVLKPGGLILLIVEVNHEPTPAEPITLGWQTAEDLFGAACDVIETGRFEIGNHDIYGQLKRDARYNEIDPTVRPGILVAKLKKRMSSAPGDCARPEPGAHRS